jgi:hypothetical protein
MIYKHDFNIVFSVKSKYDDPKTVKPQDLRRALNTRIMGLDNAEIQEACEYLKTLKED